jgi:UDP-N-acetyl-D-mannosaminuronic acid dehydrogenase
MKKDTINKYFLNENDSIKKALSIFQNTADHGLPAGLGIIVDNKKTVIGSISEGDIRRAIISGSNLTDSIKEFYEKNPICFNQNLTFNQILELIPAELSKRNRKSQKYLNKIILLDDEKNLVKVLSYHELWEQRVAMHRNIVVLGLGYVGLTLALVLADEGFLVTGVDLDKTKIDDLKKKKSYVHEKGINEILTEQSGKNFIPTTVIPGDGDVYIISVGTPIKVNDTTKKQEPFLDYIKNISIQVAEKLKPGNLVILRSTVPTGLSRNLVLPLLEKHSGLKCGKDFHLSFAPERTAEGKALQELRELPQIIGGINEESVEATAALFRELTSTIIRVSSLESAEMIKLINNTFRDIVFSYSNYITQICSQYNLDVFEIIKAANNGYPRNPVPYPSPGVGGPCLTKDPYIFSTVLKEKIEDGMTLFEHGRMINENMHSYIVERIKNELKINNKSIENCKIIICGLAFKGNPETGDIRNSSAVEIHNLLKKESQNIFGHDPVASSDDILSEGINNCVLENEINNTDVLIFLNNHIFYQKLNINEIVSKMANRPIIFDGWNIFRSNDILNSRLCTYMGLSFSKKSVS